MTPKARLLLKQQVSCEKSVCLRVPTSFAAQRDTLSTESKQAERCGLGFV
jgi:hypothetical protein